MSRYTINRRGGEAHEGTWPCSRDAWDEAEMRILNEKCTSSTGLLASDRSCSSGL
jgi:hypothetical protein